MAESKEELNSLLMEVKEESEKLAKNSTFRKLRSWHLVPSLHGKWTGKQWETIFGGSKITADGDCIHEIKRCLLLGRKVMTNLDSILKSRDITLPTKVCLVKLWFGFSSSHMWELNYKENWALKNWCFWMLLNCGVGEDPWESLGLQGDPISPF